MRLLAEVLSQPDTSPPTSSTAIFVYVSQRVVRSQRPVVTQAGGGAGGNVAGGGGSDEAKASGAKGMFSGIASALTSITTGLSNLSINPTSSSPSSASSSDASSTSQELAPNPLDNLRPPASTKEECYRYNIGTQGIYIEKAGIKDVQSFKRLLHEQYCPWIPVEKMQVRRYEKDSNSWKALDGLQGTGKKKSGSSNFPSELGQWSDGTAFVVKNIEDEPFYREATRGSYSVITLPLSLDDWLLPWDEYKWAERRMIQRSSAAAKAEHRSSSSSSSSSSKRVAGPAIQVDL